ncbi:Crp/Fnr family transcriptional regulator [Williamwhitmania taraxaci]|uniref:cAMP-binding domain of CRP or a regulatory subunit of cAMP-dependent protein kinases n=1 Tax=Williamwhitmania taraxaci TaxID=1640674 RepID=A0A1G6GQE8_9BACT|nr:Crp/Fnr family transcriptional regulator [Williamwhitmania taraxaci]SDB84230.1 cAMP-binding domain of CRP or a regulatory subunit of cAMP-dependent protein kinases [Williamwhitmania taraxaci]
MFEIISRSPFFRGLSPVQLEEMFSTIVYSVKTFSKGQLIAQREDEVRNLCVLIQGSVKGEMVDFTGKVVKIEEMQAPMPIAHAFVFGEKNRFPVDVVALEEVRILFIPKSELIRLLQGSDVILGNYLNAISNRAQFLSSKLWFLSFRTIREKVAQYLLSLTQESKSDRVIISKSQGELAEFFGVARPSLARVFSEMEQEGLITVERKEITIKNRKALIDMLK